MLSDFWFLYLSCVPSSYALLLVVLPHILAPLHKICSILSPGRVRHSLLQIKDFGDVDRGRSCGATSAESRGIVGRPVYLWEGSILVEVSGGETGAGLCGSLAFRRSGYKSKGFRPRSNIYLVRGLLARCILGVAFCEIYVCIFGSISFGL